jgi:hypothetical protein
MKCGPYGSQPRVLHATRTTLRTAWLTLIFTVCTFASTACSAALGSAAGGLADPLTRAILEHDDPDTVRDGVPALLLALDAVIEASPQHTGNLRAGARLYSTYSVQFAKTPERAQRLADRALRYAERAVCGKLEALCAARGQPFARFEAVLAEVPTRDVGSLYVLGESWAAWIAAHSSDWAALAELPRVEAVLARVVALDDGHAGGNAHLYLAVLLTQRPESLGGRPGEGRLHFERAIELSAARNLNAKVMFARYYARLVFDRALHDRLLHEVLDAPAPAPGLTLSNVLAQSEAKELLATADEYF